MTVAEISGSVVLRRGLRRQRRRVVLGIVLLCAHQATEALVPVAIGVVIDRAVATGDVGALLLSLAGLAALFTALAFAYRTGARLAYAAVEHEAHTTRVEIVRSALDPRGHRSGMRDGELLSVTASDAELSALVVRVAGLTAAALTAIVVAAVALLVVDVPLGLGVLVGVPLLVVALQRMAPLLTRRSTSQQEALAATTALAVDLVTGLRVLRGIGAQDHAARRYAGASRHALDVTLRAATTKGLHLGLTTTVNGLFLATVAGVAGWLALQGRLTVGELVAVVGLAQFIAEPVQTLGYCVQLFATARASAARVARVLGAAPVLAPGDAGPPEPSPSRLALDAVSHAGLDTVSLHVRAGEILGVLAYDPSDAEALVALLAGRVPRANHRGTLYVDGVPAEDLHVDAVRAVVLVEPHDVALFEGTLRANLSAGAQVDDTVLRAAVRAAAAEDVLTAHPDGFDRRLTERGANLSGGQRQRIGLARALVADPPVLVLHNPTTAVDAVTEALLAEGLAEARAAATRGTVLITTSPALLNVTHRVTVIDRGRVVAEGPHGRLLADDARYREEVLR
ncbi:ABC transporter ATP-binding protein [Micromonospora sp. WMMD1155]|uniref:ABC transporter transmembrane domain-containing protein n=1 Tax=Micromonospora sp. WMMD1155 TaxID=3016094 RepID=UPI00249BD546|nr:ABC transporter ATP-binding protein [Micromonospora sp. WMMD1155]WFE53501.1 ABC transporter ATP-binding protein [Micromonospora sp. WMMD1155]